jgi:hypothetical protein
MGRGERLAEQREQRGEVGGGREVGFLVAEGVFDGVEDDGGLLRAVSLISLPTWEGEGLHGVGSAAWAT